VPRKNNRQDAVPELDLERVRRGAARVVSAADGAWYVRTITAAGAVKEYRCPGCDHEIAVGFPHVVVWPADDGPGWRGGRVEDRRHWHSACWNARARRGRRS
jgi:hypothetical protein